MSKKSKDNALVPQNSQAQKNLQSLDIPTTYIPTIKVTYPISEHCMQQKANPGEFYYNNELSLGNTIQVTALGYRYQAMAIDKTTKEFVESLVLGENVTPFREREEYIAFCKSVFPADIQDGIDILLFLPEHNLFGVIFTKKKLLKGGLEILDKASDKKIVQVKTIPKNWKKFNWYILEVTPTGETVEIPRIEETLEIYNSQTIGITEDSTNTDDRKR